MDTATFVARFLAARGVRHAFGHPGSDVMDLIEAMDRCGITYVLTHHENTGAFMAGITGRLTGVPGVVLVTKGPGITNVATGIGSAHLDRSPLLLFSSHINAPDDAITARQHVPAARFYEPITKLSEELTAANVQELLPRAVRTTISGYFGPAYLPSLASEQVKDIDATDAELEAIIERGAAAEPAGVDGEALAAAGREVAATRRLLVLVGAGVEASGAFSELLEAVESLGAPVAVTPQAVGLIPADHPLYVGLSGWHDAALDRLMAEAELILTVGLDGADVMIPHRKLAKVINLGPTSASESTYGPVGGVVAGELGELLRTIAVTGRGARDWGEAQAAETRTTLDHDIAVSDAHKDADGIAPQDVFTALRDVTPRDTIFTTDVGAHKIVAGVAWKSFAPLTFFISNGFGSMGYGLASAMGAKLARPDSTVVSVIGDGGFLMYAGDLATWARLNLPLVLVVMVDNDLTQVQRRQEQKGYSLSSTTFQEVDYGAVAGSFGIDSIRAENAAEYRAAVEKAVKANRPIVVEAALDSQEYRRIPGWK